MENEPNSRKSSQDIHKMMGKFRGKMSPKSSQAVGQVSYDKRGMQFSYFYSSHIPNIHVLIIVFLKYISYNDRYVSMKGGNDDVDSTFDGEDKERLVSM